MSFFRIIRTWYGALILLAIIVGIIFTTFNHKNTDDKNLITTTVTSGTVREVVSISGLVEAKNTADLAFPASGKVTDVFVDEGAQVKKGEVLATLAARELVAKRNEAVASLNIANAAYAETISGPTKEARAVTDITVENAKATLAQIKAEYNKKVQNALITLNSDTLEALAIDPQETATAPTVTGTYTCDKEGTYVIDVYNSNALSGYSYKLTGLDLGTYTAYTDQPAPLGSCGLYIQFTAGDNYNNSSWKISIPNTHGSSYVVNKNAYDLILEQEKNAIAAAEDALNLAQKKAVSSNAGARSDVVKQKRGAVTQAQARIAQIDAQIADRSIVAPFAGEITNVDVLPGETVTSAPVITILAENAFKLTAKIPEIDITKIKLNQKVEVVFDAKTDETLLGSVVYISPLATEIDGVAYFEATISLTEKPNWLRSGLNADVNILISEHKDVLRIPKRFLIRTEDGKTYVKTLQNNQTQQIPISITAYGNDGYMAIEGVAEGSTIIVP